MFFVEGCTDVKRNVFFSFLQEQSNSGLIVGFCLGFFSYSPEATLCLGFLATPCEDLGNRECWVSYQRNVKVNRAQSLGVLPEDSGCFSELHRSLSYKRLTLIRG